MVEGVEEFRPELEQHPLRQTGIFVKCEVPLIESRSMEESPLGIADLTELLCRKRRGIKKQIARPSRIEKMDGLAIPVGCVNPVATTKRLIVAFCKSNWESRRKTGNSRQGPARK